MLLHAQGDVVEQHADDRSWRWFRRLWLDASSDPAGGSQTISWESPDGTDTGNGIIIVYWLGVTVLSERVLNKGFMALALEKGD
jgi:hypothetical protein